MGGGRLRASITYYQIGGCTVSLRIYRGRTSFLGYLCTNLVTQTVLKLTVILCLHLCGAGVTEVHHQALPVGLLEVAIE